MGGVPKSPLMVLVGLCVLGNVALALRWAVESLPLLAVLVPANVLTLGFALWHASRGGVKGPALRPLLTLLSSWIIVAAFPWPQLQAQNTLGWNRPEFEGFVQRMAAGDIGETIDAGPRWVHLSATQWVPTRAGEVLAVRQPEATWVAFPLYRIPFFGYEGGLLWSRAGGPALRKAKRLDDSPQGVWYYYAR